MIVRATHENVRDLAGLDWQFAELLVDLLSKAEDRNCDLWVRWTGAMGASWLQWQLVDYKHRHSAGLKRWLEDERNWA
jgi:hypothetical protein